MLDPDLNIAFIGGGNMAEAMISGLLSGGHSPKSILVCAPSTETQVSLIDEYQIVTVGDNRVAALFADVIVLAVKPHIVPTVCEELNEVTIDTEQPKLVLSVAAGVSHLNLRQWLGGSSRVICAMPNLPSAIGKGMTGLYTTPECDVLDVSLAESLMSTIGETLWVQEEQMMASMVATAGSSPAYFFLLMEAMQKVAMEQGMSVEQAKLSIQQAAFGAASMAVESDEDFGALRKRVTSPNGTTEKALQQFTQSNIEGIVRKAMTAAADKTRETYHESLEKG